MTNLEKLLESTKYDYEEWRAIYGTGHTPERDAERKAFESAITRLEKSIANAEGRA
ncbi:MAG: hypothetical protein Q7U76_13000 [Nitrospirota bacterium]|nr:hypothetical protein [Nitrospirota bacterium]